MKKITLTIITLLAATVTWAQVDRSIKPKPGPAPEITFGKTESFTLPNGLKVFVVENHKLPAIAASIQFDIKPELQGDATGYQDILSELLTRGTKSRTGDQFNQETDFIGASLNAYASGISARGLKKYQDKILELMADVAMNADFKQEELDKQKTRILSGMEAAENDPDAMLDNVANAVNYGKNHPYGEIATKESIQKISLADCKKYYTTYFRPNVAYMAIVGDISMAEIKPLVEKHFGQWQKATVPVTKYDNPATPTATNVAFAARDAAVQSVINITYPVDLTPGSPDVIKAKLLNSILGGGSNGRLFQNLREKHAWTYGSYSSLDQDELKGSFTAYAKCRNAVSDSSVAEILAEMDKLRNEKVDAQELQNHIANMSGVFAISLENPGTIAQHAINIERYKMPKDYYKNYLKNVAAVTVDDIQATARKFIHTNKAHIVVVGNKEEVSGTLIRFDADGKIDYYDSYGRKVKQTEQKVAPAGMTGDEVVLKYIAAIGGEKAFNTIKDIKTVSKGEIQGMALTITRLKKEPGKFKMDINAMGMTMQKVVVNGDKGYQEAQGQKQVLENEDLTEVKELADICADCHASKYGFKHTLKGMEKLNDKDVYVVETTDALNKKRTRYFDATDYLLLKEVRTEDTPQGAMTLSTEYGDYKEVPGTNGYKFPYMVKLPVGPGMSITATTETVEVNAGIPDTEFE